MLQIIGKGGFAREIAAYYKKEYGSQYIDYPIIFAEFEEIEKLENSKNTIIGIGDPFIRKQIASSHKFNYTILDFGKTFVSLGEETVFQRGTIICPGTILTTNIKLGEHVIINLNCTIGHDVKIGDFTTLSPGVNVSGNVTIGELCYIGTNAVIKEKITICDNVIIGAGGVVVKDITEPGTYVGNPIKKIK